MRRGWLVPPLCATVVLGAMAAPAAAQVAVEAIRTRDGLTLELPADGAWRARAREVARLRAELRAQDDFTRLN